MARSQPHHHLRSEVVLDRPPHPIILLRRDREVERAKEMMGDAPLPPESDDESSWDGDADREAREGSLPPERGWPAAKAAAAAAAAAAEGRELQAGAGAGPGSAVGREGAVGAVQVVQMERQEVGSNGHFKSQ